EGTEAEVDWMLAELAGEWRALGVTSTRAVTDAAAGELWRALTEFSGLTAAPLVLKASVPAGPTVTALQELLALAPQRPAEERAGNGIVLARFSTFDPGDLSKSLVGRIQPAAARAGGEVIVLASNIQGLTRQVVWGGLRSDARWMSQVKRQFDPKDILNPG